MYDMRMGVLFCLSQRMESFLITVNMEQSGLLVVAMNMKEMWKFVSMVSGVSSVTVDGALMMLRWHVLRLATLGVRIAMQYVSIM